MDLMSLTAVELGKKIQAKEVTVEEAVKAAIASIKAKEELLTCKPCKACRSGRCRHDQLICCQGSI